MLYRIWEVPVTLNTSSEPYVRLVSMTPAPGTIGYVKDDTGDVTVYGSPDAGSYRGTIENLAEYDEVGIFNPAYYTSGSYTAEYTYVLNPPLEYDSTTTHLNLKLAGALHIPYRQVKISIPASGIDQIYVYPPSLKTENAGDTYIITGSLAADEILAIEMLGPSEGFSRFPGFRNPVNDVQGKDCISGVLVQPALLREHRFSIPSGRLRSFSFPCFLFLYTAVRAGEGGCRSGLPQHHTRHEPQTVAGQPALQRRCHGL